VLHVLKTRDHKQAEVEQLAEFLASTQAEKESMESGKGRKGSITGYLKQKIDDVKGIDTQQRIAKLGNKITEVNTAFFLVSLSNVDPSPISKLQEASVTENADVLEFNSTLMRDWEVWKSLKIQDFKSFMLEHIDNQIHSNQQVSLFRPCSFSSYFLTCFVTRCFRIGLNCFLFWKVLAFPD